MDTKFPNSWTAAYHSSPVKDGVFTPYAKDWQNELTGLSMAQIKAGIDNLSMRKNAGYPPTATEFVKLCRDSGYEAIADEILDYINDGDYWKTSEAYTVFKRLRYDRFNQPNTTDLMVRIKQEYVTLDYKRLLPIPPRPVKKKALPNPDPSQFERRKFACKLFTAINNYNCQVWIMDEFKKKLEELFHTPSLNRLMKEYKGGSMLDFAISKVDFSKVEQTDGGYVNQILGGV